MTGKGSDQTALMQIPHTLVACRDSIILLYLFSIAEET